LSDWYEKNAPVIQSILVVRESGERSLQTIFKPKGLEKGIDKIRRKEKTGNDRHQTDSGHSYVRIGENV